MVLYSLYFFISTYIGKLAAIRWICWADPLSNFQYDFEHFLEHLHALIQEVTNFEPPLLGRLFQNSIS